MLLLLREALDPELVQPQKSPRNLALKIRRKRKSMLSAPPREDLHFRGRRETFARQESHCSTTTLSLLSPPHSKSHNMADRGGASARGGFGSRGDRGGDRGRGRGRRGPRRGGAKSEEKEWQPVTKLGRLVKAGKIKSMEEIYLHSLPIKEYQIVDFFLPKLKDEVMKVSQYRGRERTPLARK